MRVHYLDATTANVTLGIQIGNNYVPDGTFDADHIDAKDDKELIFPCPVLCLASQVMYLVIYNGDATYTATAKITLLGEKSIVKKKA